MRARLVVAANMPRNLQTHLRPGLDNRLRKAREETGLSQRQLSFPGCTAAYISRIEKGDRFPSLQLLNALAERLRVDPRWLATGERPRPDDLLLVRLRAAEAERDALRRRLAEIAALASDT